MREAEKEGRVLSYLFRRLLLRAQTRVALMKMRFLLPRVINHIDWIRIRKAYLQHVGSRKDNEVAADGGGAKTRNATTALLILLTKHIDDARTESILVEYDGKNLHPCSEDVLVARDMRPTYAIYSNWNHAPSST